MFGFAKSFTIVLFIAAIVSFGMRDTNPWVGLKIVGGYAVVRIIWNILTKKRK